MTAKPEAQKHPTTENTGQYQFVIPQGQDGEGSADENS